MPHTSFVRRALRGFLHLLLLGTLGATLLVSAVYLYLSPKLPAIDSLREAKLQVPLRIYSQQGDLIGEFGEKLRTPIRMEEVPTPFIHAILSAEDDRFLQHQGIDLGGLLRAAGQLFASGEIRTGGSTITMQVARNFFLSSEQTFLRKFNEIFLALQIEQALDKEEILELYVNKIYLGKRAYGIQAAASIYYGKPIAELSVAQLAMIAGLPKAPSAYNPINNHRRARVRRDWILSRMHKLGYLTQSEWVAASNEPVTAQHHGQKLQLNAGHAAEMARAFAVKKFGSNAYTDGYRVVTTLNSHHQRHAQQAVAQGLTAYDKRHGHRGAEHRLTLTERDTWQKSLQKIPSINGLTAAAITHIGPKPREEKIATTALDLEKLDGDEEKNDLDNSAGTESEGIEGAEGSDNTLHLLLGNGEQRRIEWQAKDNPLRPYLDENRRGARIKNITELFQPGDVIRLRGTDSDATLIGQVPAASAALVALRPENGAIAALVGGLDFQRSKFNRVTQAYRQPGSNFKPFVYAAALANGFTAAHIINDAPIVFTDSQLESDWRPQNSGGKFYGPTTLRRALYLSRNLVSIRLLRELGIQRAINYLDRFELSNTPLPKDLSLSLGSHAMTPLEVATAYATLANGGYKVAPYLVAEILDRNDNRVYAAEPATVCTRCETADTENEEFTDSESLADILTPTDRMPAAARIMDARIAYLIDDILRDVIQRGTGRNARVLGRNDLAGKTGTTNGPTDAWFSGYHPSLVATAWLGFDNNQKLGTREYGGSAALPIWIDFMQQSLHGVANQPRVQPSGMVAVKIDRNSGQPTTESSRNTLFELFLEESAPERESEVKRSADDSPQALDEELF